MEDILTFMLYRLTCSFLIVSLIAVSPSYALRVTSEGDAPARLQTELQSPAGPSSAGMEELRAPLAQAWKEITSASMPPLNISGTTATQVAVTFQAQNRQEWELLVFGDGKGVVREQWKKDFPAGTGVLLNILREKIIRYYTEETGQKPRWRLAIDARRMDRPTHLSFRQQRAAVVSRATQDAIEQIRRQQENGAVADAIRIPTFALAEFTRISQPLLEQVSGVYLCWSKGFTTALGEPEEYILVGDPRRYELEFQPGKEFDTTTIDRPHGNRVNVRLRAEDGMHFEGLAIIPPGYPQFIKKRSEPVRVRIAKVFYSPDHKIKFDSVILPRTAGKAGMEEATLESLVDEETARSVVESMRQLVQTTPIADVFLNLYGISAILENEARPPESFSMPVLPENFRRALEGNGALSLRVPAPLLKDSSTRSAMIRMLGRNRFSIPFHQMQQGQLTLTAVGSVGKATLLEFATVPARPVTPQELMDYVTKPMQQPATGTLFQERRDEAIRRLIQSRSSEPASIYWSDAAAYFGPWNETVSKAIRNSVVLENGLRGGRLVYGGVRLIQQYGEPHARAVTRESASEIVEQLDQEIDDAPNVLIVRSNDWLFVAKVQPSSESGLEEEYSEQWLTQRGQRLRELLIETWRDPANDFQRLGPVPEISVRTEFIRDGNRTKPKFYLMLESVGPALWENILYEDLRGVIHTERATGVLLNRLAGALTERLGRSKMAYDQQIVLDARRTHGESIRELRNARMAEMVREATAAFVKDRRVVPIEGYSVPEERQIAHLLADAGRERNGRFHFDVEFPEANARYIRQILIRSFSRNAASPSAQPPIAPDAWLKGVKEGDIIDAIVRLGNAHGLFGESSDGIGVFVPTKEIPQDQRRKFEDWTGAEIRGRVINTNPNRRQLILTLGSSEQQSTSTSTEAQDALLRRAEQFVDTLRERGYATGNRQEEGSLVLQLAEILQQLSARDVRPDDINWLLKRIENFLRNNSDYPLNLFFGHLRALAVDQRFNHRQINRFLQEAEGDPSRSENRDFLAARVEEIKTSGLEEDIFDRAATLGLFFETLDSHMRSDGNIPLAEHISALLKESPDVAELGLSEKDLLGFVKGGNEKSVSTALAWAAPIFYALADTGGSLTKDDLVEAVYTVVIHEEKEEPPPPISDSSMKVLLQRAAQILHVEIAASGLEEKARIQNLLQEWRSISGERELPVIAIGPSVLALEQMRGLEVLLEEAERDENLRFIRIPEEGDLHELVQKLAQLDVPGRFVKVYAYEFGEDPRVDLFVGEAKNFMDAARHAVTSDTLLQLLIKIDSTLRSVSADAVSADRVEELQRMAEDLARLA